MKYLGVPEFWSHRDFYGHPKPYTFTTQANLGMEDTVGVGNPLDLSQPQDSHVYAFPPLRYNHTYFVATQIVNEY